MTKLVSLSNEAYSTLKKMKGKNMSFSDIVLKLVSSTNPKRDFLRLAGTFKSESPEFEAFKKQIDEDRKRNKDKM